MALTDEPKRSILEQLPPMMMSESAWQYIRNELNIVRNAGGDPELFTHGDLEVVGSLKEVFGQQINLINKALDQAALTDPDAMKASSVEEKRRILIEKDPILGPISKMDGQEGLSKEEAGAMMFALDALPHAQKNSVGIESPRISNFNQQTGKLEAQPNENTVPVRLSGIGATIKQTDLDIAANHMKEFLATARQYLGDNYDVKVYDEHQQEVDTRDPTVNKEYTQLIKAAVKDIRHDVDHGYSTRPSGGGRGGR